MAPVMLGNGKRISSTVKGEKLGRMEQRMRETTYLGKSMVKVPSAGPMVLPIKAPSVIIKSRVWDATNGPMEEFIEESGDTTK